MAAVRCMALCSLYQMASSFLRHYDAKNCLICLHHQGISNVPSPVTAQTENTSRSSEPTYSDWTVHSDASAAQNVAGLRLCERCADDHAYRKCVCTHFSGATHSDRVIRIDANNTQKCGRFVSQMLRGRSGLWSSA
jgi:hypothetical protein